MISTFNELNIFEYKEKDFKELAKLFRDVYVQTYPSFDEKFHKLYRFEEILRENTLVNSQVWTAKANESIVGFLALEKNFIDQLYIQKEFQTIGLGSFWVNESKRIYSDFLELYTFACNEKAISFYEKHNFKIVEKGVAPDEKMPDVKMRWDSE